MRAEGTTAFVLRRTIEPRALQQAAGYVLFALLCLFTLTTWDGDEIATRIVSGMVLLTAALYFAMERAGKIQLGLPPWALLAMTGYGVLQTLVFPQKIVYQGWTGVLFWLTAAAIAATASRFFRGARVGARFRLLLIIFGTSVCVLDLLEQASQTNKYFWLFQSHYPTIFGTFAYWNNFAEFVEIVLPLTLWRGLSGRRPGIGYLLAAAIQVGAVVASGSRAGTVLVGIELIAVIAFAYRRNRNRALLAGAALAVALSVVFVYAAGYEALIHKLQQNDQLAVRRKIDQSSIAMIRARPWSGWGLETYVPVYRMFALYDDGTFVNRAHNDWLQWAAEGGVFFSGAMLLIFVWTVRPAMRSPWALGLIAVAIHALVDYPFARFGVCGWYFYLVGMLSAGRLNRLATARGGA